MPKSRKAPVRLVGEAREIVRRNFKARYDDGATIAELAEQSGFSTKFTHTLLTEAGTVLRRSGRPRKTPALPGRVLKALYEGDRLSIRQLAHLTGSSKDAVRDALVAASVEIRKPGRPRNADLPPRT